jgi:DNA-binding MarR family transcriptional regulator
MSAIDTAKEFVRLGSTVGLSKDVIDLLDKKASLLAEQVMALEQENTTLLRENRQLKLENEKLQKHLHNARQEGGELDEIATKMLVTLANHTGRDGITSSELIQYLGLPKAKGDYHFDQLQKRKFVNTGGGVMGRGMFWYVTSAGRDYLARVGLL